MTTPQVVIGRPRLCPVAEGIVNVRDGLPADSPSVLDGPDVRKARVDLDAAGASAAALVDDRDQLVVALENLLRFHVEPIEAVHPAAEEALETVTPGVRARVRARRRLVPLDVAVDQLEDDREIAPVERLISALERFDVRLGHSGSIASAATRLPPRPRTGR